MGGGLMQLVAYGARCLSYKPANYFLVTYRRHTLRHGVDWQTFNGQADSGRRVP